MKQTEEIAESLEEKLERMRKEAVERNRNLMEWAAGQPQSKTCKTHGKLRTIDWEETEKATWRNKENTLVYKRCPVCLKYAAIIKESKWLKDRGVPGNLVHCSFDNFEGRSKEEKEWKGFAEKFAKVRRGFFVMVGDVGIGKSHLAVSIMRKIGTGRFITNYKLMQMLRDTYKDRSAEDIVRSCQKSQLLILDEVGISGGGTDELPTLHRILDHRHGERLPTVLTTNIPTARFKMHVGERFSDRLKESSFRFLNMQGSSKRSEQRDRYFGGEA